MSVRKVCAPDIIILSTTNNVCVCHTVVVSSKVSISEIKERIANMNHNLIMHVCGQIMC